jgi:hypothetical protein
MNSTCTSASDFIFTDAVGKSYAVKDVSTSGDCTLLSLMGNPNFQASLSTANELRRAVVTFARGVKQQDCMNFLSVLRKCYASRLLGWYYFLYLDIHGIWCNNSFPFF